MFPFVLCLLDLLSFLWSTLVENPLSSSRGRFQYACVVLIALFLPGLLAGAAALTGGGGVCPGQVDKYYMPPNGDKRLTSLRKVSCSGPKKLCMLGLL